MQVICQHCGTVVSAQNINIQHMTAICPACGNLFEVELNSKAKNTLKRRKIKRPQALNQDETHHTLDLSFRTNFRLHQNQSFMITAYIAIVMTFLTLFMIGKGVNLGIFIAFVLVVLAAFYNLALIAFNKTHIHVKDQTINVSRKPLPTLWQDTNQVNTSGIANIHYAETPLSIREGYDLPRYNVWAEMIDGSRKPIVHDVIEDYAVFIAQELSDYLNLNEHVPISDLFDDFAVEDDTSIEEATQIQQNLQR
jgi:hypothetical protein